MPPAFSLKTYAPTPQSQGSYGNCTAWAIAYAGRTILESVAINRTDSAASRRNAFSPYYLYEQIKSKYDKNCDSGSNLYLGLRSLLSLGLPRLNEFPATCSTPVKDLDLVFAASNRIAGFARLDDADIIGNIKKVLAQKKPVMCALTVTPSFQKMWGKELWVIEEQDVALKKKLEVTSQLLMKPGIMRFVLSVMMIRKMAAY